jgi:hypothetical protein
MTERSGRLPTDDGHHLAWRAIDGSGPTVVWFGGFRSDMGGTKAEALAAAARERGWSYLRFDWSAHGESSGEWASATIGAWRRDALSVIDRLTEGPLLIVGSSMGGWLACLAAIDRPGRLHSLCLIAPAPDFTEALMRPELEPESLRELALNGVSRQRAPDGDWNLHKSFLDEGRDHLILDGAVPIRCPVRILQGALDEPVPWRHALKLAETIESPDVVFSLIKDGDHRLSRPWDIARLIATVEELRTTDSYAAAR